MEFYLYRPGVEILSNQVSIPNGMEFYRQNYKQQNCKAKVSIPNGMEFYTEDEAQIIDDKRFNSQRDGILHHQEI